MLERHVAMKATYPLFPMSFVAFHTWNTNPILGGWSVFYFRANFCHMAILFDFFKIEKSLKMAEFYPKFQWVADDREGY